jgi:hypothetical protein
MGYMALISKWGIIMATSAFHRETITVVAKTYPECSYKYGCLVCTAGINEQGEWRRLYPIPWALFWGGNKNAKAKGFQKFDIISLPIRRKAEDYRYESYYLNPHLIENELQIVGQVHDWTDKRAFLMTHLDHDLESLRTSKRSLGLIKPYVIQDFFQKDRTRLEPDEDLTIEKIEAAQQGVLFDVESELVQQSRISPEPLPWIGYRFLCHGADCRGHEMMCIDWEIQSLYRKYKDQGAEGFQKVKARALEWMNRRDIYFVVGTTWRYGTWLVIGLFYPPKHTRNNATQFSPLQQSLF